MRVVVIGSGHNGLVCAAMLARAGHQVTVIEAHDTLGGATRTSEIIPGYRTSTASYSMSLFRPDIWHSLGLGERIQLVRKEPAVSVPYPDGRWLSLRADPALARASIESIHPPDADNYLRWEQFWETAAPKLRAVIDLPEPPTLKQAQAMLGDDLWEICVANSAAETASKFFESDELRGLVASQGIVGTANSVDEPGTAWILSYHAFGGETVGATGAWAYVIGGTGAISSAIAEVARDAGANIYLDSPARRIIVSEGKATGVEIVDGTILEADVIVSNAHPAVTFALAKQNHPQLGTWDSSSRTFKVNLALKEMPVFAKDPTGDACRGTLSFTWGLEHLRDAYKQAETTTSPDPWMEVFVGSSVDASLVDGSGATLSAFCQYSGPVFDPATASDAVIGSLDRAAPGLAENVLAAQVLGPVELEDQIGLVGGNIFHGELGPPQIFNGRFAARAPIQNLYLCGSGTHPGGAITGAPGRNAALAILADHA